jgi:hypothetical protein
MNGQLDWLLDLKKNDDGQSSGAAAPRFLHLRLTIDFGLAE